MFQSNVDYTGRIHLSAWRKAAIGSWRTAGDPSVYGMMEIRAEAALAYAETLSTRTGERITVTHILGKCVAETLRAHPSLNCVLRFGYLYQRKNVDIFFQVSNDADGKDLSGTIVREAETKTIPAIAAEMANRVKKIRAEGDRDAYKIKGTFALLPPFVVAWLLTISGFIAYKLNIWSPLFGSPRDAFGSIMITNVGSLGIDAAFAPLVPYSHCPCVLALGAVRDRAIVENGEIKIGKILQICVTFDHRLIDGVHASKMTRMLKNLFENPTEHFG